MTNMIENFDTMTDDEVLEYVASARTVMADPRFLNQYFPTSILEWVAEFEGERPGFFETLSILANPRWKVEDIRRLLKVQPAGLDLNAAYAIAWSVLDERRNVDGTVRFAWPIAGASYSPEEGTLGSWWISFTSPYGEHGYLNILDSILDEEKAAAVDDFEKSHREYEIRKAAEAADPAVH